MAQRVKQLHTVRFTIPSGSDRNAVALSIKGLMPIGLVLPAAWTDAPITFSGSADNQNFGTLRTPAGKVIKLEPVVAGNHYSLLPQFFFHAHYLFVVSGDLSVPDLTNQAADREMILICEDRDAAFIVGSI